MIIRNIFILIIILIFQLCAEQVLFVESSTVQTIEKEKTKIACYFYGLDMKIISIKNDSIKLYSKMIIESNAKAIIFTAEAISMISADTLFFKEMESKATSRKIIIVGITDSNMNSTLIRLSNTSIKGCNCLSGFNRNIAYSITDKYKDITRELSGQEFKPQGIDNCFFLLNDSANVQNIMEIKTDGNHYPDFIRTDFQQQEVFLLTGIKNSKSFDTLTRKEYKARFVEMAPLLMFLKYTLGDYCWHTNADYANLIIDDPWLIEPYGFLNYHQLLDEMKKADFHTTIAFIPWNYDRNKAEVVELFRKNPNRFSLCIHGNNHDHTEFDAVAKIRTEEANNKNMNEQLYDINQAIARMEQLTKAEGIPYDKVMVFPNGAFIGMSLDLMKNTDILATVNHINIPIDSNKFQTMDFFMRAGTNHFSNFLSIRRDKAESITEADIARELFLDNPLLIYTHHDFFINGINAFNKLAVTIKQIQPKIRWCSIGNVVRNMYMEKMREDGCYDILPFVANFTLENRHTKDATYFIRKTSFSITPIKSFLLDNKPYPYTFSNNILSTTVYIPSGSSVTIRIEYEKDPNRKTIGIAKKGVRIWLLRNLSDFRDLVLSRNAITRIFINAYDSNSAIEHGGLVSIGILFLGLVFIGAVGFVIIFKHPKKK